MSFESAVAADPRARPPELAAGGDNAVHDQALTEVMRTGDRETIEGIVFKLAGQLEALKTEAKHTQSAELGQRHAGAAVTGALRREDEHFRRRLSSLPEITPAGADGVTRDRRKRMTMAFDAAGPEAAPAALACAYCGADLDDGLNTTAKAALNGDVGYCCSNCESILSLTAAGSDGAPAAVGAEILTNVAASDDDGDASDGDGDSHQHAACETCHELLGDEYVNVLGRRFHVMHFVCDDCSIPLYALGGYLQDPSGEFKFYCQRDYLQRFSPACHACSVQITSGEMAVALGRTYHSDCFVCSICQSPFVGDVCYEYNSQPLCEWHWYTQNGLLCSECGGIISSHCVVTRGKKYHQHCAEAKYAEAAVTIDEARRQVKAAKSAAVAA
ncbi:Transforming growth factor beta-1-induced transcript 1 protein [Coemansia biformis]|uniref:Transforming growth factor beta-1-induced transcript 1 protein n=1 Tax=Coemansia biformis TaxID=1286918 RepID=A0A9W7YA33_9FUNG|nr:Transforming growth factor beta-1-induced transcript 1 protein [Coemansia biformis]